MAETRVLTVLIVEDDPADALLIRRQLERARELTCRIEARDRIAAGLARLDEGGVDVVLLDFSLPDSLAQLPADRVR